jgi:hypothetical protein
MLDRHQAAVLAGAEKSQVAQGVAESHCPSGNTAGKNRRAGSADRFSGVQAHRGRLKIRRKIDMNRSLLLLMAAGLALAGCASSGPGSADLGAAPVQEPMTHTRAAEICWMSTEKGDARMPLDKRADLVDRCIAEKMGTAPPKPAPDAKKKMTASAADGKHRIPVINGNKKKKPAVVEANKKKPTTADDKKKPAPAAAKPKPKDDKPADGQNP